MAALAIYAAAHWPYFSYVEYNTSRVVTSVANIRHRGLGELHGLAYRQPLTGATADPINTPYVSFIQGQLVLPGALSSFIDGYVAVRLVNLAGLVVAVVLIVKLASSSVTAVAPALGALAFLFSPHVFDEFFIFGDHPVAVLPWFLLTLTIEGTQWHRRMPIALPLSYAAIALTNHAFLLVSVPAAFLDTWESRLGAKAFFKGLATRLWLAGLVESAYWGWLAWVSPEYPKALLSRAVVTSGLEGTARTIVSGLRYIADATGFLEKERGPVATNLGKLYVVTTGVQTLMAGLLWVMLIGRRSPRSIPERVFLTMFAFYALLGLIFREAVFEHPYLYTPYLVIALTIASFGAAPLLRTDRHAAIRWMSRGLFWMGCALLAMTLIHGPWRFRDRFRSPDTAYPDPAAVTRLADYFAERWRGHDAVVVIDSDDKETFLAEQLLHNGAALAFARDQQVRVKMVTTDWLRQNPSARATAVSAYRLSMHGSEVSVETRRGLLTLSFIPTSIRDTTVPIG